MSNEPDVFEKPTVERLVTGGTYVLIFSLLAGAIGWAFMAVASQDSIGVGGDLLGFLIATTSLNIIGISISGGFHQSLSKYVSESLVESKEKAKRYAKAGFFVFNIIGIIMFSSFIVIALYVFPNNLQYGIVFAAIAIAYYLGFLNAYFIGNLASVHRFDHIGKATFLGGLISTGISFAVLFLVPEPINAWLLPITIAILVGAQLVFTTYYAKRSLPYPISSIFRGARRPEIVQVFKYGLFCVIPNIVFSAAILWIQNLWYSGFFGFEVLAVTANGLILGYAGIVFAICNFGWPQIPAVAEAKAMKNFKLIDDYMKNTLHNGFNITALFLIIYVGLSHQILLFFHGPDYLIAHIPFIILSCAVAVLGVEFLICTLMIGLGEGKKAAILISALVLTQIICVPLGIILIDPMVLTGSVDPLTLYAGPTVLLISAIAAFPIAYHYLKKFTSNPPKTYSNIIIKGTISIALTLICYGLLDLVFFPLFDPISGFLVRAVVLFMLFTIFMLIFAGYTDGDLDVYEKTLGPAGIIVKPYRWILHHSPFYETPESTDK